MEDIFEETIDDIDKGDVKNPLVVADYVEDLYAYYRRMEVIFLGICLYLRLDFDVIQMKMLY